MIFLIKSTIILGILLAVYHLLLEKEKMHGFNRFYLLSGLVLAFVTPLITVGYIDVPTIGSGDLTTLLLSDSTVVDSTNRVPLITWPFIIQSIYIVVAFGFLLRFLFNLSKLLSKTLKNEKVRFKGFTLVLIKEAVLPHTFFNYVFINKDDYQQDRLEDQLFTHELTHAHQMHSLDIIMIELIQIIFWFNPLILIYKRAIQLNHEFLADEQVIKTHGHITDYQHLLVDKAGNNNTIYLASNLNFSVTKKRLTMMNRTSNRWRKGLYAAATLPLFICLLLLLGNQAYAQSSESRTNVEENSLDTQLKTITVLWNDGEGTRVYKSYDQLSQAQKQKIKSLIPPPPPPHEDQDPATMKKIPVFPENSVIEFNVQKNTVRRVTDLNSIPPPPPPKAPKVPYAIAPPPPPPAPPVAPPPPPAPPSPLDTAIDMAKNGGTFSLNGEMVKSDIAIAALKNKDQVKEVYIKKKSNDKRLMIITTKN